jgi:hypothetical protein
MARKCIYANRAKFGELRELIAELSKLVFTDEVPETLLGMAWGTPRAPGREDPHELRGRSRRVKPRRGVRTRMSARSSAMCWAELRQEAESLMGQLNVHPGVLQMHRDGCTAATRCPACCYANRADIGQLREIIAELRKLVFTGEVLGET